MVANKIKISLDGQREIYTDIVLTAGDFNAYALILEFEKNGGFYDVTGYNISVYAKREGTNVPIPDVGRVENGKGYYVIKPSMYLAGAELQLEVILSSLNSFTTTTILHFTLRNGFSNQGGAVVDEKDYSVLAQLIQMAQNATDEAISAANYTRTEIDNFTENATFLFDEKADKQNQNGGFVGGNGADSLSGGAVGESAKAGNGGAIGNYAVTTFGGAVGEDARATDGGAVGAGARATDGGAVGAGARATDGGAVGAGASATDGGAVGMGAEATDGGAVGMGAEATGGGAVGEGAKATGGGAVGMGVRAFNGFSGGKNAKSEVDSIQLGEGTNIEPYSLQIYDKKLLDLNGKIPYERLTVTDNVISPETDGEEKNYPVTSKGVYSALENKVEKGETSLFYTIAPMDAVNKDRADLILTADDPARQINNAFTALDNARNNDPTVAVRVDFLGGKIDTLLEILVPFDNFHLYGNGVVIYKDNPDTAVKLTGNNIIFTGFNCRQISSKNGEALYNTGNNCTITGNTLEGEDSGLNNTGEGCTIIGNNFVNGLYDNNDSLTNKTIIIGNTGSISVNAGSCLPATQEAMAAVNNSSEITGLPTATYPPSIIAQNATNRFVTDTEKTTWNSKTDKTYVDGLVGDIESALTAILGV